MSIYKLFKTDAKCESEGVTLDYGDGVKIRIARAGGSNKTFMRALERLGKKYRRQIQLDILPPEVDAQLFQEVYADTIVLGWEGATDEAGQPLPFTRENVLKLFQDLPDLWADVRQQAQNLALFRAHLDEADGKN